MSDPVPFPSTGAPGAASARPVVSEAATPATGNASAKPTEGQTAGVGRAGGGGWMTGVAKQPAVAFDGWQPAEPATVSVQEQGSWLLSFGKNVSEKEVARWLFANGQAPAGVAIRARVAIGDKSAQWEVSYKDWSATQKGDSFEHLAQFDKLLTPYGKEIAGRALAGGEPTPREAVEVKAHEEKISVINAVHANRFIPALNMTALEATEKLEPGVYELRGAAGKPNDPGYFVWLGYKTTDRGEPRLELQIVTKSDNQIFNKDMRFWMSRGLDAHESVRAFTAQWDDLTNTMLNFTGVGAGLKFKVPRMIEQETEVATEAADFAKLSDEVALERAMAVSKQPETVVIKTEIAVREEQAAVRGEGAAENAAAASAPIGKPNYKVQIEIAKPTAGQSQAPATDSTSQQPDWAVDWMLPKPDENIPPELTLKPPAGAKQQSTLSDAAEGATGTSSRSSVGGSQPPANPKAQQMAGKDPWSGRRSAYPRPASGVPQPDFTDEPPAEANGPGQPSDETLAAGTPQPKIAPQGVRSGPETGSPSNDEHTKVERPISDRMKTVKDPEDPNTEAPQHDPQNSSQAGNKAKSPFDNQLTHADRGLVLGPHGVQTASDTAGSMTARTPPPAEALGLTSKDVLDIKQGGSVSATTFLGEMRFRLKGDTLTMSVIPNGKQAAADFLKNDLGDFSRKCVAVGRGFNAKTVRLQFELVDEIDVPFLKQNGFLKNGTAKWFYDFQKVNAPVR